MDYATGTMGLFLCKTCAPIDHMTQFSVEKKNLTTVLPTIWHDLGYEFVAGFNRKYLEYHYNFTATVNIHHGINFNKIRRRKT